MLVCQWHLDVVYGKQSDALAVIRAWGAEKLASSGFSKATFGRVMVGAVGASPSHIVDEYLFNSLEDFESALKDMGADRFRAHSDRLAPLVVPGSQKWIVWRVV